MDSSIDAVKSKAACSDVFPEHLLCTRTTVVGKEGMVRLGALKFRGHRNTLKR